ncbi:MAG: ABC transporter permease subunit [Armatimonadetes bacterium]|nr:ABC transporter permease subunit [Armatimonadota bacterium]
MIALLKKEARELIGTFLLCLSIVLIGQLLMDWVRTLMRADSIELVCRLTIAVVGALFAEGRFAGEASEGTLTFLLSQPVTRWRVWCAKALAGWLATVLIVAAMTLIYALWTPETAKEGWIGLSPMRLGCPALCFGTLAYFATLLCSTFLETPTLAAAAGVLLTVLGMGTCLNVPPIAQYMVTPQPSWLVLLIPSAFFALASAAIFSLRETMHRRRGRQMATSRI